MFLKNYTSNVPSSESIAKIERVLLRCGVTGIAKEYGPHADLVAIAFYIPTPANGSISIRLPADKDAALRVLWEDYCGDDGTDAKWGGKGDCCGSARKKLRRQDFVQQAERTAWKLMVDWIEVQMSMIQMQQAETLQVFLPYVMVRGEPYYNQIKTTGYRALLNAPQ